MARLTLVLVTLLAVHLNLATAFRLRPRDGGGQGVLQVPIRNVHNQMYTVHVEMANPPVWFNFSLALTQAYSAVIGVGCPDCSTDSTQLQYNPVVSSTYVGPQLTTAQNTTIKAGGKTITGALGKENCGFKQQDGEWWRYKNQSLIVASSGTDSSAFGGSGGIAGFGQSNAQNPKDTLINQYLTSNQTTLSQFIFGLALYDQGVTQASNGVALDGDSSGGFMHLDGPDPAFYTGTIQSFPVVSSEMSTNWGSVPGQLGSFDWTVQTQGWLVKTAAGDITGSQGMYGTMEANYPYLLLPQKDANKLYAAIPGSVPYVLPANAADPKGVPIYQDNLALSWAIPCNTTNVSFFVNFQGVSVPLLPSDFMTKIGGVCVGNVKGWADATRQTGILGNAFFRNAYVVFTASADPTTNTIGLANRPLIDARGKDSATKNVVIGAVVGGLIFLICVGLALFFVARHWKTRRRSPPSAIFASAVSGGSIDDDYAGGGEKRHSVRNTASFLGLGSPTSKSSGHNYVAEPWLPPTTSSGSPGLAGAERGVVVAPWTPQAPSEQAFLSPTGNALDTTVVAPPYTASSQHSHSALPPTPLSGGASSPAPTGYRNPSPQRPMSGQSYASYSPLPTSDSPRPRSASVASSNPTSPTPLLQQFMQGGPGSASQYHGGPPSSSQYHGPGQQYSSASQYLGTPQSSQYPGQPPSQVQNLPPGARPRSLPPPPPGQGGRPY
ncbi:hypothetical protein FRC05_001487 [Tulasnella sp. 425]|nr:hypothetical protein FRC05_001487 [Tulasnella sp. 425]